MKTVNMCKIAALAVVASMALCLLPVDAAAQKRINVEARKSRQPYVKVLSSSATQVKDCVEVEMDLEINEMEVERRGQMRIMPILVSGHNEQLMPPVVINGSLRHRLIDRSEYLSDDCDSVYMAFRQKGNRKVSEKVDYHVSFPIKPWMRDAQMIIYCESGDCRYQFEVEMQELLLSKIKTTEKPVFDVAYNPEAYFIQPPREAIKVRTESGQANIVYRSGRSDINPSLGNNMVELDKIRSSIDLVKGEPTASISGITVMAYASPEGSAQSNQSLSQRRAADLSAWIRRDGHIGSGVNINSRGMGEDWDGLVEMVKKDPGMSEYDKSNVTTIINSVPNLDTREGRIKALNGGTLYRYIFDNMYPALRRSEYRIEYSVPEFTLEKSKEIFKTRPGLLSLAELYAIANEYEKGSAEFNEVFDVAARLYPDDKTASLNAAAAHLAAGDQGAARRILSQYEDDPQAWINLGVLSVMEGELDKAEQYFKRSQSAGVSEAGGYLKYLADYRAAKETYELEFEQWRQYGFE